MISKFWGLYQHLTIILRGCAGYEVTDINEGRSAELVIIILYPANPSRIIVFLKLNSRINKSSMLISFRSKTAFVGHFF